MAIFGEAILILLNFQLRKGPPEAVIIISSTLCIFLFFNKCQIEKCSESTGINFVLLALSFFSIKFQAQIIDSLLAIAIVFVCLIISRVGCKPDRPEIPDIV